MIVAPRNRLLLPPSSPGWDEPPRPHRRRKSGWWERILNGRGACSGPFQGWPCCSCSVKFCVTSNCTGSVQGAVVTCQGQQCTTDGTGCCTINNLTAGSSSVTVTYSGHTVFSGTRTLVCGGTQNFSIGSPSGFVCCNACLIPTTLSLTDSNGTWSATSGGGGWTVSYTLAESNLAQVDTTCGAPNTVACDILVSGNVAIGYNIQCNNSGGFTVTQSFNGFTGYITDIVSCCPAGDLYACQSADYLPGGVCFADSTLKCVWNNYPPGTAFGYIIGSASGPFTSCSPLAWSGTISQTPPPTTPPCTALGYPVGSSVSISA